MRREPTNISDILKLTKTLLLVSISRLQAQDMLNEFPSHGLNT